MKEIAVITGFLCATLLSGCVGEIRDLETSLQVSRKNIQTAMTDSASLQAFCSKKDELTQTTLKALKFMGTVQALLTQSDGYQEYQREIWNDDLGTYTSIRWECPPQTYFLPGHDQALQIEEHLMSVLHLVTEGCSNQSASPLKDALVEIDTIESLAPQVVDGYKNHRFDDGPICNPRRNP